MTMSVRSPVLRSDARGLPVRPITGHDIVFALRAGWADFVAMPTHVIFVVLIYPVIGLVLARLTFDGDLAPLLFPLAAGFALLGPFAALGPYELSRRREGGLDPTWRDAFEALRSPAWPAIAALGGLLLLVFVAWIATARTLYGLCAGDLHPASLLDVLHFALTTPAGWALIVIGNATGFLFAVLAFVIGVVSFPMLLDRGGTAVSALDTSLRAVLASPGPMAVWGVVVAVALLVGCLPVFVGLTVVLPVLGHATWHLYRRAVPALAGDDRLARRLSA